MNKSFVFISALVLSMGIAVLGCEKKEEVPQPGSSPTMTAPTPTQPPAAPSAPTPEPSKPGKK